GVFCHKPSTVSGGGKSEISKSMQNAIKYGPFYIQNLESASEQAALLINYDYSHRWKNIQPDAQQSRPVLSPNRTLRSAVKLLTPSDQYSDEYNRFLEDIPVHVKILALYIKRMYRSHLDKGSWKDFLNVELVN